MKRVDTRGWSDIEREMLDVVRAEQKRVNAEQRLTFKDVVAEGILIVLISVILIAASLTIVAAVVGGS